MSIESVKNILIGSTMQFLDKKLIIGEVNPTPIAIFNTLRKAMEYALNQYNAGDTSYFKKIKILNKKIQELKYQCPDICVYRDRYVIKDILPVSIPTISDNTITRDLALNFQVLPQAQVIYNYENEDGGSVAKMKITSKSSTLLININNQPVNLNQVYPANLSISVKPDTSVNTYLSRVEGLTCSIIAVNTTDFNAAIEAGHRIFSINSDNSVTFQYLFTGGGGSSSLINYNINGIYIGEVIQQEFMLRVQSINNTQTWSNSAKIVIDFTVDCETVETCNANLERTISHISNYTFTPEDFGLTGEYDKIMITGASYNSGTFRWKDHLFLPGNVTPTIVTKQDLINGDLYWFPSSTAQQLLTINFKTAKENSYNYCNNSSNFTLTKTSIG